jgi:hypothetical protein
VGRKVIFLLKVIFGIALAFRIAAAQTDLKTETVPILSAGVAFVPTVEAGQTTLTSVVAPVLLVPIGDKWLVESRVTFEGDFARQNGTGPYVGPVEKEIDYAEVDYIANKYITVTAGRFLTPFGIYNERLYPVWVRNLQTEPLILPLEESSSNGAMLRGGIPVAKDLTINYAAFFSTLSTNAYLGSDREFGGRIGVFLPKERVEVGVSVLHKLQDEHENYYGAHVEWQPRRVPLDIRSEYVNAPSGRGYWVEPALRLTSINHLHAVTSRLQVVGRVQQFLPRGIPDDDELPDVKTERAEFGFNYYIADGWRAVASTGRQFSSEGNHNVWTVGMTYRFAFPLGHGGL